MDLLLDLLQGLGVALACGLSPFLPVLVVAALAAADLGVDFDGTAFSFLEEPWCLVVLALLFGVSAAVRVLRPQIGGEVGALGVTTGALLFAATLDDRHDTWWYGLVVGALAAAAAFVVARVLVERVRERFARTGDAQAAAALPVYADGASLVAAGVSVALPPVSLVLAAFVGTLGARQRARGEQKYAGLRILR